VGIVSRGVKPGGFEEIANRNSNQTRPSPVVFRQATAMYLTGPQPAVPPTPGCIAMTYALTALVLVSLALAAAAVALAQVERGLRGLHISLTSDF
jgi:hypothetical protein